MFFRHETIVVAQLDVQSYNSRRQAVACVIMESASCHASRCLGGSVDMFHSDYQYGTKQNLVVKILTTNFGNHLCMGYQN